MGLLKERVPFEVLDFGEPNPVPLADGLTRPGRIEQTQVMRVGFKPDNVPFSYYNARGELVGFDVDMAHRLSRDLGVGIVFVPFSYPTLEAQLREDHFDIAMSGIAASMQLAQAARLTEPYLEVSAALVVRDHLRRKLPNLAAVHARPGLTLGIEGAGRLPEWITETLPDAEIVRLWSASQFFEGPPRYMDGLIISAEAGSAWTLLYPEYSVVNPFSRRIGVPLVYLLPQDFTRGEAVMDEWLSLRRADGTIENLYEYWILGRRPARRGQRWSIARDVLGWIE